MANRLIARELRGTINFGTLGVGNGRAALELCAEIAKAYNDLAKKHNLLVAEVEALKSQKET